MTTEDLQKEAIEAVQQEMMRVSMVAEAQRNDQILFQQLLLDVPEKPKHKPVTEVEIETEEIKVQEAEVQPEVAEEKSVAEDATGVSLDGVPTETVAKTQEGEAEDPSAVSGEIVMQEGESLADVKARMKREQAKAKKPTIPPELLNNANSYEDKVGVVRMVVQNDQSRVASVIRSMIQTK
jgi:hypothetical protein